MNLYKLVWKNIFKNKYRTLLVVLSVLVSFFIFGFVFALGDWLSGRLASGNYVERLVIQSKYSLPLKWSSFDRLQNIDGVLADTVTGNTVLAGFLQTPDKKFFQRAVNAQNFIKMEEKYLVFNNEDIVAWLKDRRGAFVGRALAEKFGFKKGDTISLISPLRIRKDSESWVFNIHGIFDAREVGVNTKFMVFHDQYLIEGVGDFQDVDWYELNINKDADPNIVAKSIDDAFKTSSLATSSEVLASITNRISSQAGDFYFMAKIIIAASFFTLFLVVGSSVFRTIKERSVDIAVLKTLGFRRFVLSKIIYEEVLTLVLMGGIPAVIALSLIDRMPYISATFTGFFIPLHIIFYLFIAMFVFAFLITVYPAYLVGKNSIVDSLKRA